MKIKWRNFGQDIKYRREIEYLSVRDAAKRLKLASATFSRADRGLPVSAETFLTLTYYFLDTDPKAYLK